MVTGPDVHHDLAYVGRTDAQTRHPVPLSGVRENPAHLAQLEAWLRSYGPDARAAEAR